MATSDIMFVVKWWLMFFVIGLIFLPLTIKIFSNFFDKGYIFARILGMAIVSYAVFVLGILKILPFTELTIFLVVSGFLIINILISKSFFKTVIPSLTGPRLDRGLDSRFRGNDTGGSMWKIFVFEELLFISTLFFWSYIRAHQPDIHGLEKYEDFGFINSILRSEHFPPKDMWFTPLSINYYYFGHVVTAVLTKLSNMPSYISFNLMLATIFSLTFTSVFSIVLNLLNTFLANAEPQKKREAQKFSGSKIFGASVVTGLLSGFLATLAGNLHTIYAFFKPYVNENPVPFWQLLFSPQTFPNSYWYPNATRFIHNTIHEFPLYSFVVSDLHAHVLDMPFVLLTIALLLNILISKYLNISKLLLLSFMLAIMYMTNAWDGIIYFLLTVVVIAYLRLKQDHDKLFNIGLLVVLVFIGSIVFSLPFSINFKPFASGIGVLCAPQFLTDIGRLGPFLFEKDHCLRSPNWQLSILYGFFYFWVVSFLISILRNVRLVQNAKLKIQNYNSKFKTSNFGLRFLTLNFELLTRSDIFILLLILLSTLLIIIPEFIYIKDIYPGHYRANTMFKLVYQSFIMLSITSGYIIIRVVLSIKYYVLSIERKILTTCYILLATFLIMLVFVYPYFAINSYYNLKIYQGLDGIKYLKTLYPADYEGILWINKNIKGQPVILEAQGDSYTDYARISSNTGLPTVLGWTVHEWLWRGTYDIPSPRIPEVQTLYETESIKDTKKLIDKYKIQLIFIGKLEREKYPKLNEEKFKTLGKVIYKNGETRVYKIEK